MDGCNFGWMDRRTNRRMIGWTDGWMGKERIRLKNRRKSVGKGSGGARGKRKRDSGTLKVAE